jgi:capsular exopolysaccharide synthesis family protein
VLNQQPTDLLPGEPQAAPPSTDPNAPPAQGPGAGEAGSLSDLLVEERIIATYLELVERRPVLEQASAAIGYTGTIEELEALVSASNPEDTQLIRIRAENTDPDVAAAIANAVANQFIALSEVELGRPGLLALVEPATPATTPFAPSLMVNVALAFVLAAVGAVTLGLVLDALQRSVRSPEDVHEATRLPTLGMVPTAGSKARSTAWATETDSEWATAFRRLRGALSGDGFGTSYHSLFITSESPGAGKSLLAANLAVAYANAGFRVLLIDLDLHGPTQHQIFGLSNELGVASELGARDSRNDAIPVQATQFNNLSVIPAGRTQHNPEDVLALGLPPRLLQAAYERADIVIVDGPAMSASAAAGVLPASFDASLLVVAAGATTQANLRRVADDLEGVSSVVGVVINRAAHVPRQRGRTRLSIVPELGEKKEAGSRAERPRRNGNGARVNRDENRTTRAGPSRTRPPTLVGEDE